MTEIHPPRLAEAILESLGATPEFRDAIIGDLAQEHAQRAERFGNRAARLWYYRQAFAATPALLRNWISGAKFADARRLLNVIGLAYVMTMMVETLVFFGLGAVANALREWSGASLPGSLSWLTPDRFPGVTPGGWMSAIALGLFAPLCAGYFAATFEESKPMVASIVLAFAWAGMVSLGMMTFALTRPNVTLAVPMWVRVAPIPFIMAACVFGGVLRVRRVSALRVAAASSSPS